MTHHPHVHMIVAGGGLSVDGKRWITSSPTSSCLCWCSFRLMLEKRCQRACRRQGAGRYNPSMPRKLSLKPVLDNGRRLLPSQSDLFELGDDLIELLTGELAPAQCSTQIGPIQQLRPRCGQPRRDAGLCKHPLHVFPPSAVYVPQRSRGLGIIVRPSAHANFQCSPVPDTAQERLEAFFARVITLEVGNDRLRRRLFPMLDHSGMKSGEVLEVPIEAATRDAKLARKHIGLESIEALARERS
jgi:Putative transposase